VKGFAAALACLLFAACGGSSKPTAATPTPEPTPQIKLGKRALLEDCASAVGPSDFAQAFAGPENLVVGPLAILGGAHFDPDAALLGGQRFLVLAMDGHTVTVRLAPEARTFAGLAYGRLRDGEVKPRESYRSVTFAACSPDDSSDSATMWSGYVLTRRPECIPLEVSIDGGAPQRVGLTLGERC
jgi:hypothetical protein